MKVVNAVVKLTTARKLMNVALTRKPKRRVMKMKMRRISYPSSATGRNCVI